ncbi:hypothetical protein D3C78_1629290 [compost metagenome]
MLAALNSLVRGRETRAPAFQLQQIASSAFSSEIKGQETTPLRHFTQNNRSSTIPEQYTGIAIRVICNSGQSICTNN